MLSRNIKKKPQNESSTTLNKKKKLFIRQPQTLNIYVIRKNDECWLVYSVSTCMLVIKKTQINFFTQTIEKTNCIKTET